MQWLVSNNILSIKKKTDHHPLDLTIYSTIPRLTKWTKFAKLDWMKKPGLSEKEFHGLFMKCNNCQMVTMREVFRYHLEDCKGYQHEGDRYFRIRAGNLVLQRRSYPDSGTEFVTETQAW